MGKYIINGNNKLSGEIDIQGSKNSALAILMACIITNGETVLKNLPNITDVKTSIKILRYLGCEITYEDTETVRINTKNAENIPLPLELTASMRASSYLIGALTAKFGECALPVSGGCDFGTRPIDLHISALRKLGAETDGTVLRADKGLTATKLRFPQKTVGGTVNTIIAASKASGITVIENAAREPHIKDLCKFLNKCGAEIVGGGSDIIRIRGKRNLHGATHTIGSDMIEAGTYICAALASGGCVKCNNAPISELDSFLQILSHTGATATLTDTSITVKADKLYGCDVVTSPYPGFPTDLQPQICALLGIADGKSKITETVFKNRFGYLKELQKCGLIFDENDTGIEISGIGKYCPAELTATDLRGGAAEVICALNADGKSIVSNTQLIERGYSFFVEKMSSLGADIVKADIHCAL